MQGAIVSFLLLTQVELLLAITACGSPPIINATSPITEVNEKVHCPSGSIMEVRIRNVADSKESFYTGAFLFCDTAKKVWMLVVHGEPISLAANKLLAATCIKNECPEIAISGGVIEDGTVRCFGGSGTFVAADSTGAAPFDSVYCSESEWTATSGDNVVVGVTSITCNTCPGIPIKNTANFDVSSLAYNCAPPRSLHVHSSSRGDGHPLTNGTLACIEGAWFFKPENGSAATNVTDITKVHCCKH